MILVQFFAYFRKVAAKICAKSVTIPISPKRDGTDVVARGLPFVRSKPGILAILKSNPLAPQSRSASPQSVAGSSQNPAHA
jgi:hypothetical protein